jgi:hypothetical protein
LSVSDLGFGHFPLPCLFFAYWRTTWCVIVFWSGGSY